MKKVTYVPKMILSRLVFLLDPVKSSGKFNLKVNIRDLYALYVKAQGDSKVLAKGVAEINKDLDLAKGQKLILEIVSNQPIESTSFNPIISLSKVKKTKKAVKNV